MNETLVGVKKKHLCVSTRVLPEDLPVKAAIVAQEPSYCYAPQFERLDENMTKVDVNT
jgi:hypothetical protein